MRQGKEKECARGVHSGKRGGGVPPAREGSKLRATQNEEEESLRCLRPKSGKGKAKKQRQQDAPSSGITRKQIKRGT